ncbi:dihydrofolate reductase [Marinihelvus fidelis]|uniref:Dihydrofolate reductase n=2 Tax=Marinihelvus fidelis TaxID=2613842 RepID=A0A5N0T759_9GAMM|nr:dihydrofolate reductase [Marinihelvus fidelis]
MGRHRGIGIEGRLPWHLPAELRHFKQLTMGKPILMGRKTFESIGRPLPGRQNLVVTRNADWRAEGCQAAVSLAAALALAESDEVMVIGGGELYRLALPVASRMVLTMVDAEPEVDTWFPQWPLDEWRRVSAKPHPADADNPLAFRVDDWARVRPAAGP